jgi:GntR family transcriptional regulator/MocR family aminotransferase
MQLTSKAREHGIATPSLSSLYIGNPHNDGWLLGFAALQPGEIHKAIETLRKLKLPNLASS